MKCTFLGDTDNTLFQPTDAKGVYLYRDVWFNYKKKECISVYTTLSLFIVIGEFWIERDVIPSLIWGVLHYPFSICFGCQKP